MQGTIAQIVALTTYGNSILAGSTVFDLADFYPGNSTFQFCEHVPFVDLKRKLEVGKTPIMRPTR